MTKAKKTQKLKKQYKPSHYNYLYEGENGKTLLYNCYTGSLVNVFDKDKQAVKGLLKTPNNNILQGKNQGIFNTMLECGFVVDEITNELDFIRFRQLSNRFADGKILQYTLISNRACNFRCIYCFEEVSAGRMTKEDIDNLIQFTKNEVEDKKYVGISITWYGGEPLLAFSEVKEISEKIMKICETNNLKYYAQMVSNGYLLDEEKAKELVRLKVSNVQFCLDGTKKVHDQRRVLINGGPTFEKIKEGILIAKKYFDSVEIRLNTDKENAEDIEKLLQEEWLYGKNVQIRTGPLRHFSSECSTWTPGSKGFAMDEYYAYYYKKIAKILAAKKAKIFTEPSESPVRGYYCGAQLKKCYAIAPGGIVYKCISALNQGDEVGLIKGGKFYPNNKYVDWFLLDATHVEPCKNCKLLPMCLGGCPTIRGNIADENILKDAICGYFQASLDNWLKTECDKITD